MNVDAKDEFLNRMNDIYNQETYFIATCYKFPDKYSAENSLMDAHLLAFFKDNNNIVLSCGTTVKYCDKDTKRKIKLADISDEMPDIHVINNYVIEDKWNQIDW
jgi:hypothetical protein